MKEILKKLPWEVQDLIRLVSGIASKNNVHAYLVGGFVRDLIIGVENLDLDIVIEGDGIKIAEDTAHALKAKLIRHRRFGTATVIYKPHLKADGPIAPIINPEQAKRIERIDFSSARKEFYPQPAHLPVVTSSSLKDDIFRRDFTINAMAISISGDNFGKLIDYFNGKADLSNKKIRIMHNLSFVDDPTRILRAIRFEQRYNFQIEPHTLLCLKEAVWLKMLQRVEPQRMRDDLVLILKERFPLKSIKRIYQLSGFHFISPHLSLSKKHYALLASVEANIIWFNRVFPKHRKLDSWLVYFIGLVDELSINDTRGVLKKFVFHKGEEKRVLAYKKIRPKFIAQLAQSGLKPSKVFGLLEHLSYEVILLIRAKYGRRHHLQKHIEDFFKAYNGMRLFISGDDLRNLGIAPGPRYQKIFARVLKAKLDSKVKTRDEEMSLIKKLAKDK